MRTTARVTLTGLATTALMVSAGAAAHAETATVKDKASDVLSFADQTSDERGTQLSYSESNASGVDLRSMRVKHTKTSVALRVTFSDLDPTTTLYVQLRLDGSSKPSRVFVNTGETKGTVYTPSGKKRCTVPVQHRYGARGTINAVIKRSCLGTPDRVKASAIAFDEGFAADNAPFKADVLSPTEVRTETWTPWLKAS